MDIDSIAQERINELEAENQELNGDLTAYQIREELLLEALHEREGELRLARAQNRSLMNGQTVNYQVA